MICEYGCGQEALYQFKNGKWCCSNNWESCPAKRKRLSDNLKGKKPSPESIQKMVNTRRERDNYHHSEESKIKMSEIGKTRVFTEEHRQNISKSCKGRSIPWSEERKEKQRGYKLSNETRSKMKESRKKQCGQNHHRWMGGKLTPQFIYYVDRLSPYEECRSDDNGQLEVKCFKCGTWIKPTKSQIYGRIYGINHEDQNHFYCSDSCKLQCPIFRKHPYITSPSKRELQPELRKMVLERDNHQCVKCGSTSNLVCHHIDPVVSNPIESTDMDNCITLCKDCHKLSHNIPGCSYIEIKC